MTKILDKDFWEQRYENKLTGWDIGYPSTPLKEYVDQIKNKDLKILIPGCGNAYEAEYMHQNGFTNLFVLDVTDSALTNFKKRVPSFPEANLIKTDFFNHADTYDLIIEQTFFCSFYPEHRSNLVKQVHKLLKNGGKWVGVLFNREFENGNPPFGGHEAEYREYFEPYFTFNTFEMAHNSIQPREGTELFMILTKKNLS
ncbi:MAG: methyltransferase domain-containing protein [Bacteroidia bacterium]|nr:methyltransferase domain-containing protein [Bacteroidia bacterium]NNC85914.1 methyltransferase domain-containing protein [Bacteroidia bacterium]NNM16452.1 methyltransferase domain-containing protein [Bacteroidia bacterium]